MDECERQGGSIVGLGNKPFSPFNVFRSIQRIGNSVGVLRWNALRASDGTFFVNSSDELLVYERSCG